MIIKKRTIKKIIKNLNKKNTFETLKHDKIIIQNFKVDHAIIKLKLINKTRKEKLVFAITNNKQSFLFLKKINAMEKRKVVFLIEGKKKKFLKCSIYKSMFNEW